VRQREGGGAALAYSSRYHAGANLDPVFARPFLDDGISRSLAELRAAALAFGQRTAAGGAGPTPDRP
jgi:hypothetical protein